jgi:dethiobiotin synthetase
VSVVATIQPAKGIFITGTDTGVGKTWASVALMRALREAGLTVLGMKPVASGAIWRDGRLVNEDALALQAAGSVVIPYEQVNPYVYPPAVSPHLAYERAEEAPDLECIVRNYGALAEQADCVIVEGVGGWLAPINDRQSVADMAIALDIPVVVVVGLRLGCLNHARMTHACISAGSARFGGWIANHLDAEMQYVRQNLATLARDMGAGFLGEIANEVNGQTSDSEFMQGWRRSEILRLLAPSDRIQPFG